MSSTLQVTNFGSYRITDQRSPGHIEKLESLWSNSPVVLLFFRRLGCPLCRAYAKLMDAARPTFEEQGVKVVALTFESLGQDSDADNSFSAGGYWTGPLYKIDKSIYKHLFRRKSIFGLLDIEPSMKKRVSEQHIRGNLKGDGFLLGGQFLVSKGGKVLLDHRESRFGGGVLPEDLLVALQ